MIVLIILWIVVILLFYVIKRTKDRQTPVRLQKENKFQSYMHKYYGYLFIITTILAVILFVLTIIMFVPGTESGLWYNGGVDNAI